MTIEYNHFTDKEREKLYKFSSKGYSKSMIADLLGKHRSTIYRELSRNQSSIGYIPDRAKKHYLKRRSKKQKLVENVSLQNTIIQLLKKKRSPGQIVLLLKKGKTKSPISAESIYAFIYSDIGQELGLSQYLRRKRKRRKIRKSSAVKKIAIPCRTPISERPKEIDDRSEFGHWEGDLMIFSRQKTNLITLRERKSRIMIAIKNDNKESITTANNIIKTFKGNNKIIFLSCTFDNGGEFAGHQIIAKKLKAKTYFCDPYCSHQKGSVEQGNGVIRVEFPRSVDLSNMSQSEINREMKNINSRPMLLHNGASPSEIFKKLCVNNARGLVALQT